MNKSDKQQLILLPPAEEAAIIPLETGSEDLKNAALIEAIEEEKRVALGSADLTREAALGRLAQFAFASLEMFVDETGSVDWERVKALGALRLAKSYKETIKANGEITREIQLHDPIRAIGELADFAGWKQKPSENEETLQRTALAFSMWLEDHPQVSGEEKQLWLRRFARGAGILPALLERYIEF